MEVDYLESGFAEKAPGVLRDSKLNISQNGTLSTKSTDSWAALGELLPAY